jgi:hypothetical protein
VPVSARGEEKPGMDYYQDALEKLERLRTGYELHFKVRSAARSTQLKKMGAPASLDELCMLYGELEEVINKFAGTDRVRVPPGSMDSTVYPNCIEATLLSGYSHYSHRGYTQLLKVIGKVRQYADDPTGLPIKHSVASLVQVLHRFRACCHYLDWPLENESDAQSILWIMLRSHFDMLDKEKSLPKFGVKQYRPDFGIPELRVLIEVKFVGDKTVVPQLQDGILADIPGYTHEVTDYDAIIVFVYDAAQKLKDPRDFIEDIKSLEEIIDVIVVPGIGQ